MYKLNTRCVRCNTDLLKPSTVVYLTVDGLVCDKCDENHYTNCLACNRLYDHDELIWPDDVLYNNFKSMLHDYLILTEHNLLEEDRPVCCECIIILQDRVF
jgi:hypothetical protein